MGVMQASWGHCWVAVSGAKAPAPSSRTLYQDAERILRAGPCKKHPSARENRNGSRSQVSISALLFRRFVEAHLAAAVIHFSGKSSERSSISNLGAVFRFRRLARPLVFLISRPGPGCFCGPAGSLSFSNFVSFSPFSLLLDSACRAKRRVGGKGTTRLASLRNGVVFPSILGRQTICDIISEKSSSITSEMPPLQPFKQ